MLAQMEQAREYVDIDDGIFERLKYPERTLSVSLPVELDDGLRGSVRGLPLPVRRRAARYHGHVLRLPGLRRPEVVTGKLPEVGGHAARTCSFP